MGYTTKFAGQFSVKPTLKPEHAKYLAEFAGTRRMKRNPELTAQLADPVRLAVGLPIGPEGAFYVGDQEHAGQDHTSDIIDYNKPPTGQPGLWCQWVPTEDGDAIEWDGGEKFYRYVEWLEYLVENFLAPWGYAVNGSVKWQGEDMDDRGIIAVENNVVTSKKLE